EQARGLGLAVDRRPERAFVPGQDDRNEMRAALGRQRREPRDRPGVEQAFDQRRGNRRGHLHEATLIRMERILSLLPSTTEVAAALGLVDQLVGRSHECTLPPEVTRLPIVTEPKLDLQAASRALDARVKELVRDGLSIYRVDAELLRELEPDVILTQTQCEVCAVTPRDLEDAACEWIGASPPLVVVE